VEADVIILKAENQGPKEEECVEEAVSMTKAKPGTPAHILMSHGGTYNFATGGAPTANTTLKGGGACGHYAEGGEVVPSMQGMANNMVSPQAALASSNTPPTGVTPTMKFGGRRHAEGGSLRDKLTEGLHRAMGGAGKTRKHFPYT
jgi:hypothetical protein